MPRPRTTYSVTPLSSGPRGTAQTLAAMAKLSMQGAGHPSVIEAAQSAVRGVRERDDLASMKALLSDVRSRMRYTRDPLGMELVKAPWVVVERSNSGGPEPMDCDDASTLLSSMLGAVGIPSRFVAVRGNADRPREFSHVYVAARTQTGGWVPLDPIVRGFVPGEEVPEERLQGPRMFYGVGCDEQGRPCKKGCDMNRLGDSDFQALNSTVRELGGKYLAARYNTTPQQPQFALPVNQGSGFVLEEWINPFYQGQFNVKAAVVLGVGGFIAWKLFVRRGR